MNELTVRWSNICTGTSGVFRLYLDTAFPAKKTFLRKWYKKVVLLDPEHEDEIMGSLVKYLQSSLERAQEEKVKYEGTREARIREAKQEIDTAKAECRAVEKGYKEGKRVNGRTPSLGDTTRAKQKVDDAKRKLDKLRAKGPDLDRRISGYQDNLQMIKEELWKDYPLMEY